MAMLVYFAFIALVLYIRQFEFPYPGGKRKQRRRPLPIYDIDADSRSSNTPMPVGKAWLDACTVDGRIFAMGGAYGRGAPTGGHVWIDDLHKFVP